MIVVDPVTLGDTSFSRPSPATYWDRNGVLQTAAANEFRVTYDPVDLKAAPYPLIEPESTNHIRNNTMQGAVQGVYPVGWTATASGGLTVSVVGAGIEDGIDYLDLKWSGTSSSTNAFFLTFMPTPTFPAARTGETWIVTAFLRIVDGSRDGITYIQLKVAETDADGTELASTNSGSRINPTSAPLRTQRYELPRTFTSPGAAKAAASMRFQADGSSAVNITIRIGLPQLERDRVSSPIKTSNSAVTRAADVVGATAGLLYSNVPESESLWAAGTYAKGAKVRDAAHIVFESLADANTAPLTDKTKWLNLGATNRWAMFDDRNNTQTTSPEEIVVVLSPRAIAQGLLLGNTDATEIGVSVTVPDYGVVYSEISSMVVSTSRSSFFRWAFNRIKRKNLFLTLKLPIFFNGVVTVTIRRPGGVAKCGMCMIGPTVEPGPTLMGLSTEIKDYSTTSFAVDGSSSTIERGYRKLMSMDVSIDTEKIVEAEDQMIAWRQKTVVWIGAVSREDSIIVGRYSSFKKVIESFPRSKMALQIEGVLS